ncbi:MAG: porin [Myxococcota bacterium]|nr:porin [Myxococcota bacterium]
MSERACVSPRTVLRLRAACAIVAALASVRAPARAQDGGAELPPPIDATVEPPEEDASAGDAVAEPALPPAGAEPAPPPAEPVASEPIVVPEEEAPTAWTDALSIRVFADAYVAGHWTLPSAFEGDQSAVIGHRAFDTYGGPSIAFAGIDLRFAPEPIGAALDLRFGTAVPRLLGAFSGLPEGMQFLKQAFVSWRPIEQLQIDLGQFDTIYGAEVSESWLNPTYTRGALYNVVQPFYHTGLRASWAPIDALTLTAIAVNGWNNVADNNDGKSVGVQAALTIDDFSMALGYMTGPERAGIDDQFRHLVDVIFRLHVGDLDLVANADFVAEDFGPDGYDLLAGGMLAGRLAIVREFAVALRGELLGDPDDGSTLTTGTLTLEAVPDPHLIIRLDTRLDVASDPRFLDTGAQPSEYVVSSVLGVVVRSD